ncbi:hypothetical protein ACFL52_02095 [Candidatus Margulisiibacteriota bacterium]
MGDVTATSKVKSKPTTTQVVSTNFGKKKQTTASNFINGFIEGVTIIPKLIPWGCAKFAYNIFDPETTDGGPQKDVKGPDQKPNDSQPKPDKPRLDYFTSETRPDITDAQKPNETGPDADGQVADQSAEQIPDMPGDTINPDTGPICSWITAFSGLKINTMASDANPTGKNAQDFKILSTSLSNSIGWFAEAKLKLNGDESSSFPTASSLAIEIADGTTYLRLRILKGKIIVFYDNLNPTLKVDNTTITTTLEHTYQIEGKGKNFTVYVDGKKALDGTGKLIRTKSEDFPSLSGENHLKIGDLAGSADSSSDITYLKYCSQ